MKKQATKLYTRKCPLYFVMDEVFEDFYFLGSCLHHLIYR